ncbi:MAG: hypothetical protein ACTHNO_02665 [Ralstonia sp.]|uniref:hypothetical protein n=1 Tax=Ralstonia sp. TaxID=54061 RepID=UPI003F81F89A
MRLTVHGDRLRYQGPEDAVKTVLPMLAENKAAMVACVADLSRYPMADGPFMPWCAPMSPDRAAALLDDIRATVSKVADIEGWSADCLTRLLGLVARQPVSTLADDLAYFRERLNSVEPLACSQIVSSGHVVQGTLSKGRGIYADQQIAQVYNDRRRAV